MLYDVTHRTTYRYSDPVSLAHNQAHLAPRTTINQTCMRSDLKIEPQPVVADVWRDYFGNNVHYFTLEEPHLELTVTATSLVEVREPQAPAAATTPPWEAVRARLAAPTDADTQDAAQFVFESTYIRRTPEVHDYAIVSFPPGRTLLAGALDLTQRIFQDFQYRPGVTSVHTSTTEVLAQRQGVCQDFAHVQISCLRSLGLAARYVSGYLLTDPPPGQPRLIGADASHAWVSVYCPGAGWLDFDPTNNQMPRLRHVTLAWGRDFADVSPVRGIFLGGGRHSVHVSVDVVPQVR
ncbi:MAG: transglutaminase family protein [Pirellulales bacterium]